MVGRFCFCWVRVSRRTPPRRRVGSEARRFRLFSGGFLATALVAATRRTLGELYDCLRRCVRRPESPERCDCCSTSSGSCRLACGWPSGPGFGRVPVAMTGFCRQRQRSFLNDRASARAEGRVRRRVRVGRHSQGPAPIREARFSRTAQRRHAESAPHERCRYQTSRWPP